MKILLSKAWIRPLLYKRNMKCKQLTIKHGLSCRRSACRRLRHKALSDVIKRSFAAAEIPSQLEIPWLLRSDGKRPDADNYAVEARALFVVGTCADTMTCRAN